jgi:hypothetical protein
MTIILTIIETQMAIKKANKINDRKYRYRHENKDMEIK